VYRGLAGLFLLDDDASDSLPRPHTYGVDDLPLIVQDKLFTSDGQLREQPAGISNGGLLGDTILVNGVPTPHRTVTTSKVRLRLLNASNARSYNFGFADDRGFDLIGTDGGLLPAPAPLNRIQLAPGERAEIVATLRPGERNVLRSYPPHLGAGLLADRFAGGEDTFDVLRLDPAATLSPSPELPIRLADPPNLPTGDGSPTRTFALGDNEINGRSMDMDRTDFVAPAGAPETWEVDNGDGSPHTFHVHGTSFTVRGVDGRPPPAALSGWKDTVYVAPGTRLRLVLRLPDIPDPSWPYMYHCHMLRHEDAGMMGQFLVVAPRAAPAPHADMPQMPDMPDMPGMASSPPPPLPAGTR
jgi:blue copper oxidase